MQIYLYSPPPRMRGMKLLPPFARAHNIIMYNALCPSTFLLKIMFYNILINQRFMN